MNALCEAIEEQVTELLAIDAKVTALALAAASNNTIPLTAARG